MTDAVTVARRLADLAREILTVPDAMPVTDAQVASSSFINLGGDSLRALNLVGSAAQRVGVRLRVTDLLADIPLGEVLAIAAASAPAAYDHHNGHEAESLDRVDSGADTDPAWLAGPVAGALSGETGPGIAASPMQQGLWLGHQVFGGAPYCLVFVCHINGDLRLDFMTRAVRETGRRHEGLRTVFSASRGTVTRHVTDAELTLERILFTGGDSSSQTAWSDFVAGIVERQRRAPFDLGRMPPIRLAIASSGSGLHALVLVVHHILLDGWSIALVLREIFARYDALAAGEDHDPGPAIPTGAFDAWHKQLRASGTLADQLAFWQRQLDEVPDLIELPSDKPRPPLRDAAGARLSVDMGPELTSKVRAAASSAGITTTAFILAALGLTAARYSDSERLVIGMPVAGRPPVLSGFVGVTVNLLPVRIDVPPGISVRAYLRAVQESLSASLDHDAVPFSEIVESREVTSSVRQHPLVQVGFGMHHNVLPAAITSRFLQIRVQEGHGGGSQFDLELLISRDKPTLAGHLEYATGIWSENDANTFLSSLMAAFASLAGAHDVALSSIRCIGADGRSQLKVLAARHCEIGPASLDDWFRAQVARTPDAPALLDGDITLSYAELDHAATMQAALLRQVGVRPGAKVLIACPRSVAEVVAVLGVIRCGAAYCGLDRDAPPARLQQVLAVLSPSAVIGESAEPLFTLPGGSVVPCWQPAWLDGWAPGTAGVGHSDPVGSGELAYIAFTSGSTGGPKGVCVPHRGVQRLVIGMAEYAPIGPGDRVLRMSPLCFDASTLEIWGALLTGAALDVGPEDLAGPQELGQFLNNRRITMAWFTAGLFRLLVDYAADWLGGLRVLLTGGDVVSAAHVRDLLARYPGLAVVNGYGPTENTTFTTVHAMTSADEVCDPLPIGRPVAGTGICILDSHQRIAPVGAIGELCAAGDGLAAGYLGDPERTAAVFGEFCPDLPQRLYRTGDLVRLDSLGRVRFLGRRDHQVKVRGFRIELDEIRSAIMHSLAASASECLVLAAGQDTSNRQLVAVVVPAVGETELDLTGLARDLSIQLPAYMVPKLWALMTELPVTPNGKIDRDAIILRAVPLPSPTGH